MVNAPPGVAQGTGDWRAKLQGREILGGQQPKFSPARVEAFAAPRRGGWDRFCEEVCQRADELRAGALPAQFGQAGNGVFDEKTRNPGM